MSVDDLVWVWDFYVVFVECEFALFGDVEECCSVVARFGISSDDEVDRTVS